MGDWRHETLAQLRTALPTGAVEPYGSVAGADALDPWSDLDVRVVTHEPLDVERLLGAPLWAWQGSSTESGQQLRLVTRDGRRVDLTVDGPSVLLPEPPSDVDVRFDAALAATRLGRGNLLIGLHLVLGIGREALVQSMVRADLAAGTVHHRLPTPYDARAADVAALTAGALDPTVALRAYELYGRWRAEVDPGYRPDPAGLVAVLRRAADRVR
ncbi:hypothetical protein [Curtobacterium sp. PhB136]|uniref:hypothetical protein n=1 Tax=Curtobacterium sp. PhB136 TaxID=2485181 RepID=UPI00104E7463|nr:hypothetical protein [Curtobacterium sp. PhB136]TCK65897.1 hypothetical protein EDF27_0645 [Curtobacterium sp. PhB136]